MTSPGDGCRGPIAHRGGVSAGRSSGTLPDPGIRRLANPRSRAAGGRSGQRRLIGPHRRGNRRDERRISGPSRLRRPGGGGRRPCQFPPRRGRSASIRAGSVRSSARMGHAALAGFRVLDGPRKRGRLAGNLRQTLDILEMTTILRYRRIMLRGRISIGLRPAGRGIDSPPAGHACAGEGHGPAFAGAGSGAGFDRAVWSRTGDRRNGNIVGHNTRIVETRCIGPDGPVEPCPSPAQGQA